MNNPMSVYVSRLAEEARSMCDEQNITKGNQQLLDETMLRNVVGFFGGDLIKYTPEQFANSFPNRNLGSFLQKKANEKGAFVIGYVGYSAIEILHELGHAFLELKAMEEGDIRWNGDLNVGLNELEASKFARAFLMPTQLFQETVVACSTKGICDIEAVAEKFNVDTTQVVCRGRETYLWE